LTMPAPETRRQYVQDLEKFFDFSGGKPVSSVTLADLQEFSGFVHKLKLLKRQGYGRAGFDLLKARMLAA
jgi:hypothetical protein